MKLADAQLQQTTGFPTAKGSVAIGPDTDMMARSHVLVSSLPNVTTVWPVTRMACDEHGFCDVTLGEAGLTFWSMSLKDIGDLSSPGEGLRSLMRGGSRAGSIMRHVRLGDQWIEKRGSLVHHYELNTKYGPEGLHITITGQTAVTAGVRAKPFSDDATFAWPTLIAKGFRHGGAYWTFGHRQGLPSKLDSSDRPRDSRELNDLLIAEALTWPYLKGQILFTPEPSWPSAPSQS